LEKAAIKTAEIVKERMPGTPLDGSAQPPSTATATATANCTWDVHIGFHAVPSMDTVHLHVISSDLVADRLRHKKHYLSFHPHVGFWLPLGEVVEMQRKGKKTLPRAPHYYERLLRGPLVPLNWTPTASSSRTQEGAVGVEPVGSYRTMPELKRYLEKRWIEKIRARQAATGSQAGGKPADTIQQSPSSTTQQISPGSDTESETESEGPGGL
jgi:aprataxin